MTISGTHAGDKIVTLAGTARVLSTLSRGAPTAPGSPRRSYDYTARIWEVASEKMVLGPLRHSHEITSVAWEPDGQRLATGSIDETVKIWNATTGRELVTLRGHDGAVEFTRIGVRTAGWPRGAMMAA